jgi:ubiquinone/menaquinone biosynthesis C-methylase UbiE
MNPTYKGSIELLRDFWEGRSASFEKDYGIRQKGIFKLVKETATFIDGKLVLELGCGPGIVAGFYPKKADVVGLDFSLSMLKRAKRRLREVVLGDSLSLPFQNDVFGVVTCFFMASDYVAKENTLREAFRVVETDGVLLYVDYSLGDEHWMLRRDVRPALGGSCNIHIEGDQELSEKLENVGFSVDGLRYIRFDAEFRLERYVKSRAEFQRLKEANPSLWKHLKTRVSYGRIEREFVLLIGRK